MKKRRKTKVLENSNIVFYKIKLRWHWHIDTLEPHLRASGIFHALSRRASVESHLGHLLRARQESVGFRFFPCSLLWTHTHTHQGEWAQTPLRFRLGGAGRGGTKSLRAWSSVLFVSCGWNQWSNELHARSFRGSNTRSRAYICLFLSWSFCRLVLQHVPWGKSAHLATFREY